jgi:squalene-associated FAD-dependent desaturase
MRRAHVVGAGLSGLSAAVALATRGWTVTLSEAANQPGGRCRSYHDPQLDMVIDNGNHLILSGNQAVADYLSAIGARDRLAGPEHASFPFIDLADGLRWTLAPSDGPVPWWILRSRRRVPGTRPLDYLALARLARASTGTVGDIVAPEGALWRRLISPLLVSALNTPVPGADAALAAAILSGTLARGGRACRPLIAQPSLDAAFIDPAIARLTAAGADIRFGRRLRAIETSDGAVTSLLFSDGSDAVAPDEPVVLAVPPWAATELVPGLVTPDRFHAIVNAHFRMAPPAGRERMIGVIGGTCEWIFAFADRLSVTISAADTLCDEEREPLARRIWAEVATIHRLPDALPPWQIVRERRATFSATPDQAVRRPSAATRWRNLLLAGDWTATGLPATIEGALQSGATAARLAMAGGAVKLGE